MNQPFVSLFSLVVFLVTACGQRNSSLSEKQGVETCQQYEIERAIAECLSNVTLLSVEQQTSGNLRYDLTIKQPIDHNNPDGGTFEQRLVLFHKAYDRPMVLATTGYGLYATRQSEPARLLDANQLLVEHRYFDLSTPAEKNWSFMNVEQSAKDFHAVTLEFKKLYQAKWINTGASKGGMTSVYHRYYFPEDLDGTVAYVAPLSFSPSDTRYNDFLAEVGGDAFAECRENLLRFRREILKRKDVLAHRLSESEFTKYGGPAQAIEVAATEFHFVFWQYQNPSMCRSIPSASASDDSLFRFFTNVSHFYSSYADEGVVYFAPYFYQAATELGAPAWDHAGIEDLVEYPESLEFKMITPPGASLEYQPDTMKAVDIWVQNNSSEIIYIYGEFDPWTAGSFRLGSSLDRDSHLFTIPKGNHGASISALPKVEREKAYDVLARWAGVEITRPVTDNLSYLGRKELDPREFLRP